MSDISITDLAAENLALRAELARYKAIADQMSLGVFVYALEDPGDDRTLRMAFANAAAEPLAGVAPTTLIGKRIDECFPALRDQGLPQLYADVVRTGAPFEADVTYGDERVVTSAFRVRAFSIPNGEVAVCFDNITYRKQAELDLQRLNAELEERVTARAAELGHSQRLLQHVIDTAPSAIYIKDLEGRFLLANRRAAALMGLTSEQLVGRADYELFPAEFVAQWRAAEQQVIRTRLPVEQEETAPQEDGIHTFLSSRAPIIDEHGTVYAIGGVSTDITVRIRAEEAVRASEALRATIINSLPVGVMLKQASDGRFLLWNNAAEALFGASAAAVIGKTDHELFPAPIADGLWAKHQAVLASRRPDVEPEETILSPERGPVAASITRVPIMDAQGDPAYMLIITNDLSEQKRAADERAALQAQVIEAQQHALRELSTPLLPLSGRVVLMPIVGAMDSGRAQQVIETLLQGVAEHNAELAIVDITGVQVVDTQVANAFIQSARAVQLIGARVMLTGIRPEVAQTLVQLGVDLQGILTRGSLQAGIAYAFNR